MFHSVWYYQPKKNTQSYAQFNRLGTMASHGCIRLTVADSKWIYDNCPSGTKVVIYNSPKAGPLGKPKAQKLSGHMGWDPTDPDIHNPYLIKVKSIKLSTTKKTLEIGGKKKDAKFTILCLLIVLWYNYKKAKLEEKHRINREIFESKKEKELYNAKIQFFTFITHEIRTPLTLIKAPLEKILRSGDGTPATHPAVCF